MQFSVTVYRLDTPDGAVYVCTDGMLERLRSDGSEPAQLALQRYEEVIQHCATERFEMRTYTFGERLQAEWESTDWSSGEPRLNHARLSTLLLSKSLSMAHEDVEQLHPQLGQLLWSELQFRCNPSPFAWSVSASRQPSCGTENPPKRCRRSSSLKGGSADASH